VIGTTVHRAVWVRAAATRPRAIDEVAERLVRRGQASPTPWGWTLLPGLASALQRRAREGQRWRRHHAATALALSNLAGDPLQVGRCWVEAGQVASGARAILDHKGRVLRTHGAKVTLSVLHDLEERLSEVPEEEGLHGRLRISRHLLLQETHGSVDEATAVQLRRWALERGWYDTAARAVRLHAWVVTIHQDRLNDVYAEADETFLPRCAAAARAYLLGAWYLRLERFADPRRDAILARVRADAAQAMADTRGEARLEVERVLAAAERARCSRDDDAQALLAAARRCVDLSRKTGGAPLCVDLVELGHAHRRAGALAEADRAFAEAGHTARWLGIPRSEAFATGNRAGLAALQGHWDRCARLAQRALVGADHSYLRAVLELFCTVPLARAGRFEEVTEVRDRTEAELARVRPIDDEVAATLAALEEALLVPAPGLAARVRAMAIGSDATG